MNPRRVHELMLRSFPSFDAASLDWTVMFRGSETTADEVQRYLGPVFGEGPVLFEVSRRIGGYLATADAARAVAPFVGRHQIRFANRAFSIVAIIASPGVAASWHLASEVSGTVADDV